MQIDREFLNPNIPISIRFTEVLYTWIKETSERENISFNRMVLQCCKNSMVEELRLRQEEGLAADHEEGDTDG